MLYIRTDMNDEIATGHVMRCLSIADAARNIGMQTTFILADKQGKRYIEDWGYSTIILQTQWNDMESEIPVLRDIIKKENIYALLIDSYQVTENYLKELSKDIKTIYIDDLNQNYCPANTIVCYMNYWEKFQFEKKYPNAKLLGGLKYTPLREVFQSMQKKVIRDKIECLLIVSGGTDSYQVIDKILEIVKDKDYNEVVAICGRYYKDEQALKEKYREYKNVCIYKSVNDIEKYMMRADLVISAGGTTLYELCACGTPTISYAIADNQLENVKSFDENQIIEYAGDVRYKDIFRKMEYLITKYSQDIELRRERSERMQRLVDGKGAYRIVEEWKKLLEE